MLYRDKIVPDGGWAHNDESPFRLFSPARSMNKQADSGVPVIREQIYEGAADYLRGKLGENPELGEHRAIWYDIVKSYLKQQLAQEPTDEFAGEVLREVFERVKIASVENVAPGIEIDIDLFNISKRAFGESNIAERAGRCWEIMDENERTAIRIGMSPLWVTQQDLGGKAVGEGWGTVQGDEHRQLAVALMQLAKEQGGMIAEKRAGAWEEEQARGWNENIQPGASVQWYQEGSRSPNLGDVLEIDPVYQTYKVRDAYTGEVSIVSRVKLFSKKVSAYIDPANPPVNVVGSIPSEEMTIYEQDGKYWKVPHSSTAWGEWDGAIEISKEDFEYSLNPDKNLPLGFASKAAGSDIEQLQNDLEGGTVHVRDCPQCEGNDQVVVGVDPTSQQVSLICGVCGWKYDSKLVRGASKTAAGSWEMSDEKKLFDYYRQARDSGAQLDTLEDFRNAISDPTWKKYLPLNESTWPQFKADAEAYANDAADWMEKGYGSGRIAAFDESKHPRGEGGQFGAGSGSESAEPGSDEFMSRMLEVGPGPGDKVRLKDGTEAEWSEENMNQVDSWMPEMGPQQWFATQEEPKKKKRSSFKQEAQYLGKPDECPGCSGMGKEIEPGVYQCSGCGGVFGNLTDWNDLSKYVDMISGLETGVSDEDLRYFDFTVGGDERTHGWYNPSTKRVVQHG